MPTDGAPGPHSRDLPLSVVTRLWLESPDVLADPMQVEGHRIWTRARDVLPGRRVTHGEPLVAAWADQTFRARAEWDPHEMDQLWLHPLTAASGTPQVDRERLQAAVNALSGRASETAALIAIVEDLAEAFDEAVEALAASRRNARAVVRLLDTVPPSPAGSGVDLCAEDVVLALQWHARLPLRRRC